MHFLAKREKSMSEVGAAWVQAIGSIAAIIAAILVARAQTRTEARRRIIALGALIEAAIDELTVTSAGLKGDNPAEFFETNSAQELIDQFVKAAQQISPLDLPTATAVKALIKVRDELSTASDNSRAAQSHLPDRSHDYYLCVNAFDANVEVLRKNLRELKVELA
jgi:hypothetical protein